MIAWKLISDLVPTTTLSVRLLSKSIYDTLQSDINPRRIREVLEKGKTACSFIREQVDNRNINILIRVAAKFVRGLKAAKAFAKVSVALVDRHIWYDTSRECWPLFCWIYNTSFFPRWWEDGRKCSLDVMEIHGDVVYGFLEQNSTALLRLDRLRRIELQCYESDEERYPEIQTLCLLDMLHDGRITGKRRIKVFELIICDTTSFIYEGVSEECELMLADVIRSITPDEYDKISWHCIKSPRAGWKTFLKKHNMRRFDEAILRADRS